MKKLINILELSCGHNCGLAQRRLLAAVAVLPLLTLTHSAHGQGAPLTPAGAGAKYMSTPLTSPTVFAGIKKLDPVDAATISADIKSGKLPANVTFDQLPPAMKKSLMSKTSQFLNQTSGTASSPVTPNRNPFTISYNVKQLEANVPPVSNFVGFVNVSHVRPPVAVSPIFQLNSHDTGAPVDVALGRVSGIILSGGVHAIYESEGQSYILQPGDPLPDGAGRIVSILPDSIVVRISGDRYVKVGVSANVPTQNPQNQTPGFPGIVNNGNPDNLL